MSNKISCAFDDENRAELYITSSQAFLTKEKAKNDCSSGCIVNINIGVWFKSL